MLCIYINDCGDGKEIVVMLYGFGLGVIGWVNFSCNIDLLVEVGYCVLFFDCLGWGKSDVIVNSGLCLDFNVCILKSVVDQLGIDKVYLLGNLMGGYSVVVFILSWLEWVVKLVLMGGGIGGMSLFMLMLIEGIKLLNVLYCELIIENFKKMMSIFVFDICDFIEVLFEVCFNNMLLCCDYLDNFVKSLEVNLKQFFDFGLWLGEISVLILIVWGCNDCFVLMDVGLCLFVGIVGLELYIYCDCGYWVQWEYVDSFNQLVFNFFVWV